MSLEVIPSNSLFSYRQNADNPRQLEWRLNQSGKQWQPWGEPFASEVLAVQALMRLAHDKPAHHQPAPQPGDTL